MATSVTNPTIFSWQTQTGSEIRVQKYLTGTVASIYAGKNKVDQIQVAVKAVFEKCVWKGTDATFECWLFRSANTAQKQATLVAVNSQNGRIFTKTWENFDDENLKTKKPTIQNDGTPSVTWTNLDAPRVEAFDPTADVGIVRDKDYITKGLEIGKKVFSTRPGQVVAAALSFKAAQLAISYTASGVSLLANGAYTAIRVGTEWVVVPVAQKTVETIGYPALAVGGVVLGVQVADAYLPQYQIIPTIQTKFNAALNSLRTRLGY